MPKCSRCGGHDAGCYVCRVIPPEDGFRKNKKTMTTFKDSNSNATDPLPTDDQVAAYLRHHLKALMSVAPGYSSIVIEANALASLDEPRLLFRAYNHFVGGFNGCEMASAVSQVAIASKGRTEAEMKRHAAAQLIAEADALEGKGGVE